MPSVIMTKYSDHKHVVRYKTTEKDVPFDNLYVQRELAATLGDRITVSVERAE